jgi:hypothetical protein
MKTRPLGVGLILLTLTLLCIPVSSMAQVAKTGTFSLYYSWQAQGTLLPQEKGQFVLAGGTAHGVLLNLA